MASGEFIFFVDSDDWIEHTTCEKAADKINKDNDVKILINYKILKANYGKHFEQNKNLYYLIKI